jgi:hypothetical protein
VHECLPRPDAISRPARWPPWPHWEEGLVHWCTLRPPEWTSLDDDVVAELKAYGSYGPHLKEYLRRDGTRLIVEVAGGRRAAHGQR